MGMANRGCSYLWSERVCLFEMTMVYFCGCLISTSSGARPWIRGRSRQKSKLCWLVMSRRCRRALAAPRRPRTARTTAAAQARPVHPCRLPHFEQLCRKSSKMFQLLVVPAMLQGFPLTVVSRKMDSWSSSGTQSFSKRHKTSRCVCPLMVSSGVDSSRCVLVV